MSTNKATSVVVDKKKKKKNPTTIPPPSSIPQTKEFKAPASANSSSSKSSANASANSTRSTASNSTTSSSSKNRSKNKTNSSSSSSNSQQSETEHELEKNIQNPNYSPDDDDEIEGALFLSAIQSENEEEKNEDLGQNNHNNNEPLATTPEVNAHANVREEAETGAQNVLGSTFTISPPVPSKNQNVAESIDLSALNGNLQKEMNKPLFHEDNFKYFGFDERLQTFKDVNYPHFENSICNPHTLALSGFIYGPHPNMVQCNFCLKKITGFPHTADPWFFHKEISANCEFVKLGVRLTPDDLTLGEMLSLARYRYINIQNEIFKKEKERVINRFVTAIKKCDKCPGNQNHEKCEAHANLDQQASSSTFTSSTTSSSRNN